jgi:hypothetical protein
MDTGFGWILLGWILLLVCPVIGGMGLLVWAGFTRRYRLLHYGVFVAGLLVAGLSFLVACANSLALEGWSESTDKVGILGMIGGSIIACVGIMMRAMMSRRVVPFALVLTGGLVGAVEGWLLGSLFVNGASWTLERIMADFPIPEDRRWYLEGVFAVCLAPYGIWLVLIAGARKAVWIFLCGLVLFLSQFQG